MRPAELYGPVGYSPIWGILAAAGLAGMFAYFAAVLWLTRRSRPVGARRARVRELRRLGRIAHDVRSGTLSAREGHQQVSATVRSFAETVSPLPATSMTLEGLRSVGSTPLVELLDFLYEPAFSGDEAQAAERFETTVERAREVLSSWT